MTPGHKVSKGSICKVQLDELCLYVCWFWRAEGLTYVSFPFHQHLEPFAFYVCLMSRSSPSKISPVAL